MDDTDLDELASRKPPAGPRVLLFDMERIPGAAELQLWDPRDLKRVNYLHPDRWHRKPSTLCASWSLMGQRQVDFTAEWEGTGPRHTSRALHAAISDADILVGYNHLRADWRWLKTDWVLDGLAPPPVKHVDLFRVVRSNLDLPSYSLRYVLDFFGLPNKSGHYDAEEALAAAAGDERAQKRITRYNKADTRVMKPLMEKLRALFPSSVNFGLYYLDDEPRCAKCGKAGLKAYHRWPATAQQLYGGLECQHCGHVNRNAHVKHRASVRGVV